MKSILFKGIAQSFLRPLLALALIGNTAAVSLAASSPAQACFLLSGSSTYQWTGAAKLYSGVQGVAAKLDTYNPSPTYNASCLWVMLDNNQAGDYARWAQVGWVKWYGTEPEHIYLEYKTDTNSWYQLYYHASDNTWGSFSGSSVPSSGSHNYSVTWNSTSSKCIIQYDSSALYTTPTCYWTPDRLSIESEVHDYGLYDHGDHWAGDTNTKVNAQQILVKDTGIWSTVTLDPADYAYQGYGRYEVTSSPDFRIWDSRCGN